MYRITQPGPDRLDIELSGRIDSATMRTLLDDLMHRAADVQGGRMLYRLHDFDWPTLGAIGIELSRLPALFGLIRRFDRVAVLADESWIRAASRLEGALIPGLEIHAFAHGQQAEAEAWLTR
jgi:hypothetical protein